PRSLCCSACGGGHGAGGRSDAAAPLPRARPRPGHRPESAFLGAHRAVVSVAIMIAGASGSVNGRRYRVPDRPVVVVCIDGSEPAYFDEALARDVAPGLARFRRNGVYRLARCVVPSFTNPNNLSIVTGVPPAIHGISGNYFYDPATGQEV